MFEPEIKPAAPSSGATYFRCGKHREANVNQIALTHHFNHQVSVVIPGVAQPKVEAFIRKDLEYYHISNVSPAYLLKKDFIDAFCKQGVFYALSCDTLLDRDDCACVYPDGDVTRLTMVLNELTAQKLPQLGIRKHERYPDKRVLSLEMKIPKDENTWKDRIEYLEKLKFNLLVSWTPPDSSIDSRSVAAYLESIGCEVSICELTVTTDVRPGPVKVPRLASFKQEQHVQLMEWLGATELELEDEDFDDGLPKEMAKELTVIKATGFLPGITLIPLFNLIKFIPRKDKIPFVSVSIQGFVDSPVVWSKQLNSCGQNAVTLLWTSENILGWWYHSSSKEIRPGRILPS